MTENASAFVEQKLREYSHLSEAEQIILNLYSVIGEECSAARILQSLQVLNLPGKNVQKKYTQAALSAVLSGLQDKGFLVQAARDVRRQIHPQLLEEVFRMLVRSGGLPPYAVAVKQVMPEWPQHYERSSPMPRLSSFGQGMRELRFALFGGATENDIARVISSCFNSFPSRSREKHPLERILSEPFPADLMETLPGSILRGCLSIVLSGLLNRLEPAGHVRRFVETYAEKHPGEAEHILPFACFQVLLQGETDVALQLVSRLGVMARPGFEGWLALMGGDCELALQRFHESLVIIKKNTGKRKVFHTSYIGVFYLLALLSGSVRANLTAALTHVETILADRNHPLRSFAESCQPVLLTLLGRPEESNPRRAFTVNFSGPDSEPFFRFFDILCRHWIDAKAAAKDAMELETIRDLAEKNQYPWLAAEGSLLLARLGRNTKANEQRGNAFHAAHGTKTLVDLVHREEPWERTLRAIVELGREAGVRTGARAPEAENSERLVWLVSYKPKHQIIEISPRLQKRNAKGVWSGGRPVALKTLVTEIAPKEFLISQDRAAIATIREEWVSGSYGYYGRKLEYNFDAPKTLLALVGHPQIYRSDDPTVRLEIVAGTPELLVEQTGDGLRVALSHTPSEEMPAMTVEEDGRTRLLVITFTEAHQRLAKMLEPLKRLPKRAEPLMREAVAALAPLITVQSDVAGEAVDVEEVPADSTPLVRLVPEGNGLRGELLVHPLGAGGPCYRPGAGGEVVFAEVEGRRCRARRDRAKEKSLAAEFLARCPTVAAAQEGDSFTWTSDDPETCLDMLAELKEMGEGIHLEWPQGERLRVRGRLVLENLKLRIKKSGEWFETSGELQVDEELTLTLKELLALAGKSRGRFVRLDETTFLSLNQELAGYLRDLQAIGEEVGDNIRVGAPAALALAGLAEAAGNIKADRGWKTHAARLQETIAPSVPSTLQVELRDYQETGFRWLVQLAHWGLGACLADDMGLGKTVQALAAILHRAAEGPTLVVAPLSVLMNWQEEAARFAPTLNVKRFGTGNRQEMLAGIGPFDLVLASYGLLQTEAESLAGVSWQTVVLDEAQAIKNLATKRSAAAMQLSAGFRIITTGTPLENHLGELWNLFQFLNPGLLGSYNRFQERFAIPIERDHDRDTRNSLKRLVQPFILRRVKSQVLVELPPRTDIVIRVEADEAEAALYEAQRRIALEKLAESPGRGKGQMQIKILAEITRLRRLCCNPSLVLPDAGVPSAKLAAFGELLAELREGRHKVLVFSQFVDHLAIITEYLNNQSVPFQYLDGSTPAKEREKRIRAFQSGEGEVFCISLKAGGTGLNLTAADYVIHLDPWWNPAVEDQASSRAHRLGQERPVTVYRIIMKDTIEERILALHEKKRDLADSLLEGSDLAGKITPEDLLHLIREGSA